MPIFNHQHIQPKGELGLWNITEPPSYFLRRLKPKEDELYQFEKLAGKSGDRHRYFLQAFLAAAGGHDDLLQGEGFFGSFVDFL